MAVNVSTFGSFGSQSIVILGISTSSITTIQAMPLQGRK